MLRAEARHQVSQLGTETSSEDFSEMHQKGLLESVFEEEGTATTDWPYFGCITGWSVVVTTDDPSKSYCNMNCVNASQRHDSMGRCICSNATDQTLVRNNETCGSDQQCWGGVGYDLPACMPATTTTTTTTTTTLTTTTSTTTLQVCVNANQNHNETGLCVCDRAYPNDYCKVGSQCVNNQCQPVTTTTTTTASGVPPTTTTTTAWTRPTPACRRDGTAANVMAVAGVPTWTVDSTASGVICKQKCHQASQEWDSTGRRCICGKHAPNLECVTSVGDPPGTKTGQICTKPDGGGYCGECWMTPTPPGC